MNILVYVESRGGEVRSAGLEAVSGARKLADLTGGSLSALLVGSSVAAVTDEIGRYGADKVFIVEASELDGYTPEGYCQAVVDAVKAADAGLVVMTATALGRDLSPMVAAALDAAFLPDCISMEYSEGRLSVRRPVYGSRIIMTLAATGWPAVLTLRPKAFPAVVRDGAAAEVVKLDVDFTGKILTNLTETRTESAGKLDVTEADVIVAGGRGMKTSENFGLIEELAEALKGAVGASRAVVDSDWRPHSEQVGQTGKVVSPTLYIAVGISGAIQHLAGMRSSKVIVAVNKDSEAPIFKSADYGIVGDAMEVLPALIELVKESI